MPEQTGQTTNAALPIGSYRIPHIEGEDLLPFVIEPTPAEIARQPSETGRPFHVPHPHLGPGKRKRHLMNGET